MALLGGMPDLPTQPAAEALDLPQALDAIRRRGPVVLACVLLAALAAYVLAKRETRKYTATAALSFSYNPLSQQIAGLPGSGNDVQAQQESNLELVKLGDMAAKTAAALGKGLTAERVANAVSVSGKGESSVVQVAATVSSPTLAAAIANTYVHEFVVEQQAASRGYFRSALAVVEQQLASLPARSRFSGAAVALQDRAQTLRLLNELGYGNVSVAQEATAPTYPSAPKTSTDTLVAALLGLLIGLGVAYMLERVDRRTRLRTPAQLEAVHQSPKLGLIPRDPSLAAGQAASPRASEAFGLLRARLRYAAPGHEIGAVLIASAESGEGRSTVARGLAEQAARMGSRTLLVEADFRAPTLARAFAIDAGPGLAGVLAGGVGLEAAIQAVPVSGLDGDSRSQSKLDVLIGGVTGEEPAHMLEGPAMAAAIEEARSRYALIVFDAPAMTVVPDALALLGLIDGVIVVGSMGRTGRETSMQLHEMLLDSPAPLLGVVANGLRGRGVRGPGRLARRSGGLPLDALRPSRGSAAAESAMPRVEA